MWAAAPGLTVLRRQVLGKKLCRSYMSLFMYPHNRIVQERLLEMSGPAPWNSTWGLFGHQT
jgi:hypothetical protein